MHTELHSDIFSLRRPRLIAACVASCWGLGGGISIAYGLTCSRPLAPKEECTQDTADCGDFLSLLSFVSCGLEQEGGCVT